MLEANSKERPEGSAYCTPNIVWDVENRDFPKTCTLWFFFLLVSQWLLPTQITTKVWVFCLQICTYISATRTKVFLNEVVQCLVWCLARTKNVINISWFVSGLMDDGSSEWPMSRGGGPSLLVIGVSITTELCRGPGVLVDIFPWGDPASCNYLIGAQGSSSSF